MRKSLIGFAVSVVLQSGLAEDVRIVSPYVGTINNKLSIEDTQQKLDDSALLTGVYVQWIKPQVYQWNVFVYGSKDINQSNLLGGHFIFDYYWNASERGRNVIGAGFDFIRIETDAPTIASLSNFQMINNVYAPYIRFGRYFNFGNEFMKCSLLAWGGYERDILNGSLAFNLPPFAPGMPSMHMEESIDNTYNLALLGAGMDIQLFHFIELNLKYHARIDLNHDRILDVFSSMVNGYLNRRIGLSYRYKFMEEVIGENTYHIGGVAFLF